MTSVPNYLRSVGISDITIANILRESKCTDTTKANYFYQTWNDDTGVPNYHYITLEPENIAILFEYLTNKNTNSFTLNECVRCLEPTECFRLFVDYDREWTRSNYQPQNDAKCCELADSLQVIQGVVKKMVKSKYGIQALVFSSSRNNKQSVRIVWPNIKIRRIFGGPGENKHFLATFYQHLKECAEVYNCIDQACVKNGVSRCYLQTKLKSTSSVPVPAFEFIGILRPTGVLAKNDRISNNTIRQRLNVETVLRDPALRLLLLNLSRLHVAEDPDFNEPTPFKQHASFIEDYGDAYLRFLEPTYYEASKWVEKDSEVWDPLALEVIVNKHTRRYGTDDTFNPHLFSEIIHHFNKFFACISNAQIIVMKSSDITRSRHNLHIQYKQKTFIRLRPGQGSSMIPGVSDITIAVPCGEKSKQMTAMAIWRNSPYKRVYESIEFIPKILPPKQMAGRLNTFSGLRATEEECYNDTINLEYEEQEAYEMIKNHIFHVMCKADEEIYQYVLKWLKLRISMPWKRPHTMLVFIGERGIGKSTIGEVFLFPFIGYVHIEESFKQLLEGFNGQIEDKLMILLEEGLWGGHKSLVGKFQAFVTNEDINIENKFKDRGTRRNYSGLIQFSNPNTQVIPAQRGARRFMVSECGLPPYQPHSKYGEKLSNAIRNNERAILRWWQDVWETDVVDFRTTDMPATSLEYLEKQQSFSVSTVDRFWMDCVNRQYTISPWAVWDRERESNFPNFDNTYFGENRDDVGRSGDYEKTTWLREVPFQQLFKLFKEQTRSKYELPIESFVGQSQDIFGSNFRPSRHKHLVSASYLHHNPQFSDFNIQKAMVLQEFVILPDLDTAGNLIRKYHPTFGGGLSILQAAFNKRPRQQDEYDSTEEQLHPVQTRRKREEEEEIIAQDSGEVCPEPIDSDYDSEEFDSNLMEIESSGE